MSLATLEPPALEAPITRADTGLGTTYERWAVNRLLSRLLSELDVQTLFEGPDDGMCGIAGLNSLVTGLQGVRVSLLLPSPEHAALTKTVWEYHAPEAQAGHYRRMGRKTSTVRRRRLRYRLEL